MRHFESTFILRGKSKTNLPHKDSQKKMQLENLKDSQSQKWTACDNRFRL